MSTNNYVECRLSPVYSNHKMTAMTLLARGGNIVITVIIVIKNLWAFMLYQYKPSFKLSSANHPFQQHPFSQDWYKNRTGHFDTAAKNRRCEMLTFIKNHVTLRTIQSVRGKQEKSQVILSQMTCDSFLYWEQPYFWNTMVGTLLCSLLWCMRSIFSLTSGGTSCPIR